MGLTQAELMIMWGCKTFLSLSLSSFPHSTIFSSCIRELLRVDAYPKRKLKKMHVGFVFAIRDCQTSVLWDHAAGESHDRVGLSSPSAGCLLTVICHIYCYHLLFPPRPYFSLTLSFILAQQDVAR